MHFVFCLLINDDILFHKLFTVAGNSPPVGEWYGVGGPIPKLYSPDKQLQLPFLLYAAKASLSVCHLVPRYQLSQVEIPMLTITK